MGDCGGEEGIERRGLLLVLVLGMLSRRRWSWLWR
jgi:hypothetical protein